MRRFVVTLALAALVMTAGADAEQVRIPLRDFCRKSDLVFSGTVSRTKAFSGGRVIVDFDVDQVWKGAVKRNTRIYHISDSMEATQFFAGKKYVICAPTWARLDFNDPRREAIDVPRAGDWAVEFESVKSEVPTLGTGRRP